MQRHHVMVPVVALAAALSFGCVRGDITQVHGYEGRPVPPPARLLVYDFRTDSAHISLADEDASPQKAAAAVAKALSLVLVEDLGDQKIESERATGPFDVPPDAVAIYGELVNVDEGSAAKRTLVGFGYGASSIDTIMRVYMRGANGPEEIAEYRTTAASGRKPGILTTLPIGAAVQGVSLAVIAINAGSAAVGELRSSVGVVAKKTGEECAEEIHALFQKLGWAD